MIIGARGEIGDGVVFDFTVFTVGRAEEMSDVDLITAFGNGGIDVHAVHIILTFKIPVRNNLNYGLATLFHSKYYFPSIFSIGFSIFTGDDRVKIR